VDRFTSNQDKMITFYTYFPVGLLIISENASYKYNEVIKIETKGI